MVSKLLLTFKIEFTPSNIPKLTPSITAYCNSVAFVVVFIEWNEPLICGSL